MINFKISEVDWEKYEYPGFEQGDTIGDKVTGQHFRCREVATAKDLYLAEEDIPEYYKFIAIDNPFGGGNTIWVNPELFELIQKKGKTTLGKISYQDYMAQIDRDIAANPQVRRMDDPFEEPEELTEEEEQALLDEAEAAELADAWDNQARREGLINNNPVRPENAFVTNTPNFARRDGHVVDLNAQEVAQTRSHRRPWNLFGPVGEELSNEEGLFIRDNLGIARLQPNNVVREREGQIANPIGLQRVPGGNPSTPIWTNTAGERFMRAADGQFVRTWTPNDRIAQATEDTIIRQQEQADR